MADPRRALGRGGRSAEARAGRLYRSLRSGPSTPHPSLRRRTPLQAASGRRCRDVLARGRPPDGSIYDEPADAARLERSASKLHLNPEPAIDPESVDIDQLHLSRLGFGPGRAARRRPPSGTLSPGGKWGLRRVKNRVGPAHRPAALAHDQPAGSSRSSSTEISPSTPLRTTTAPMAEQLARARTSGRVAAKAFRACARLGDDRPPGQDAARRAGSLGSSPRRHPGALSRESRSDLGGAPASGQSRARSSRRRPETPRPAPPGHPDPGTVSQSIRSPGHDRHRRARRCRQPGRDLDAGIGRDSVADLDARSSAGKSKLICPASSLA